MRWLVACGIAAASITLASAAEPMPVRVVIVTEKQAVIVSRGIGTARAALTITALGLEPRLDLSKAYWLVAGIAGANPKTAPLASAFWAEWVVDGDLAYEIEARQIPSDWPTGYVPIFETSPYQLPQPKESLGNVYRLNGGLVDWAYSLTESVARR